MISTNKVDQIWAKCERQHDKGSDFFILKHKQHNLNNHKHVKDDISNNEASIERFSFSLHRNIFSDNGLDVRIHFVRIDILRLLFVKFKDHFLGVIDFDGHIALVGLTLSWKFHNKRLPIRVIKSNNDYKKEILWICYFDLK